MKKVVLFFLFLTIAISSSMAGTVFVVDNNGDGDNGAGYTAGDNSNTLRKCIRLANNTGNGGTPHQIVFGLTAGTVIQVNSDLPTINNNGNAGGLVIDATIAPMTGYSGTPLIGIFRGNGQNGNGFNIDGAGNVTIRGLAIQNFVVGIRVNNSTGSTLDKNFIGTNLAGTSIAGTTIRTDGILIDANAGNTTISNNLISGCITVNNTDGNTYGGVHVKPGNNGVKILSNLIGTDATGDNFLGIGNNRPYKHNGIFIDRSSTVANPIIISGNVISGSAGSGILASNNCIGLRITGNFIGTNKAGTKPIPNKGAGIYISTGSNHLIGGSTVADRNIISGNGGAIDSRLCDPTGYCGNCNDDPGGCPDGFDGTFQTGIYFDQVSNSKISGNFIGVDVNGTSTGVNNNLGNFYAGIKIEAISGTSSNIIIGGDTKDEGNVIGGNGYGLYNRPVNPKNGQPYRGHGIQLNRAGVGQVSIYNNKIGIGVNNELLGNRQDGVSILGAHDCKIGDTNKGNIIGNNCWGVFVQSDFSGGQAFNNIIKGNFLGSDGTNSFGNGVRAFDDEGAGVGIQHGSYNNTVEGNLSTANRDGITFRGQGNGAPAKNNNIYTNTITANRDNGILVTQGATTNNIGGTQVGQGNTISNNGQDGIHMEDGDANKVFNNTIDKNSGDGIELKQTTEATGGSEKNIIGGVGTNEANTITNNGGNGVVVDGATSIDNSIHFNSFSCNALRGIVLSSGGNNNYAKPIITGTPTDFIVTGPANSFIELYEIDLCHNCTTDPDKVQGKTLVKSGTSPITFNATGGRTNKNYTAIVSVRGTTEAHNTSEFTSCTTLCIEPTPAITGSPFSICANTSGNTFSTTLVSGNTYAWSVNGGLTIVGSSTGNSVVINVGATGGTITLTESAGACTKTVTQVITIKQRPTVNIAADSALICNNAQPTLTATANPSTGVTFQWKNAAGSDINGQTGNTFIPSAAGWYKVQATLDECTSALDSAYVIKETITVSLAPAQSLICDNKPITLTPTVTSTGTIVKYEWSNASGVIASATGSTYSTAASGTYSVKVTSKNNCSATSSNTATITNDPLTLTAGLESTTLICDNKLHTFKPLVTGGGTGVLHYDWEKDGVALTSKKDKDTIQTNQSGTYKVTITREGCPNSVTSTGVINNKTITADLNFKGTIFICDDKAVDLKAVVSPAGTYTYTFEKDGAVVQTGASDTYTTKADGNYKVTVSGGGCSDPSDVVTITNSTITAKINLNGTGLICDGKEIDLTATPQITGTYVWKRNGTVVQSGPSNTYKTSVSGDYTVTVSAGACSDESDVVKITNNTVDVTAKITGSGVICDDTAILITADTTGTKTGTIEWYKNGVKISNTGLTYSTKETGKYSVKLINGQCSDVSAEVSIINNTVEIDASISGNGIICDNKPIVITADTNGTNAGVIKWYKNGVLIPNASGLIYSALASGQYSVSIKNGLCSDSANGVAIINDTKKITSSISGNGLICDDKPITITADTAGGGKGTIKWYKDGVLIAGASALTYETKETGHFSVSVNDGMCSDSSAGVTINNNSKDISASISGNGIICDDKEITITADTTLGSGTLKWFKDGVLISGESDLEHSTKETGEYKVVVEGGGCSDTSATVKIENNTIDASATLTGSGLICDDKAIAITAQATPANSNYTFEWFKNDVKLSSASNILNTNETGKYKVVISGKGCTDTSAVASVFNGTIAISLASESDTLCKGLSTKVGVVITKGGIPTIDYTWSASAGSAVFANNDTISASPETTTTYTVIVKDSTTCSATGSVKVEVITVPEGPLSASTPNPIICSSDTDDIELDASGETNKAKLVWYKTACGVDSIKTGSPVFLPHPDSTITYYVALKNVCGNSKCKPVTVKVNRDPKDDLVDAFIDQMRICTEYKDSLTLWVKKAKESIATPVWFSESCGKGSFAYGDTIKITPPVKDTSMFYVNLQVEACPSSLCDSVPLYNVSPKVAIVGGDTLDYCKNEDDFIQGIVFPVDAKWKWVPANLTDPVLFDTTKLFSKVNTKVPTNGYLKWSLIAEYGGCEPQIATTNMAVHDLPVVTLDIPQDTLCTNVEFDAIATTIKGEPWAYVFYTPNSSVGDTVTTLAKSIKKPYTSDIPGKNYIIVTVQDINGCWAEIPAIDSVQIYEHQELVIPNLMTPNHDGKNETYIIRDVNNYDILPGAKLEVYNRWGERVYRNSSYDNTWKAENINDGMYYYYLKTGCAKEEYKGWLHIISNNNRSE